MMIYRLIHVILAALLIASAESVEQQTQHHDGTSSGQYRGHGGAINLYVSSYAGTITTLALNGSLLNKSHIAFCANNASWLTWDEHNRIIYCLDEGLSVPNGTLQSFKASKDGVLSKIAEQKTISGPVGGVLYGNRFERHGLALAHYSGSAVSVWLTDKKGDLNQIQNITFTLSKPGPNPDRQGAPYEHEAILDPTGNYVIVPDLGADLVRVFSINHDTLALSAETPLVVAPGSGPRHGVFWTSPEKKTYFYLVSELANTLTGYYVSYGDSCTGGITFKEFVVTGTHGGKPTPAGNAAAEIQLSPDRQFIIVSNRNDSSFQLPNFDPANKTQEASDSLATWKLNQDGTLNFKQLAAAGGIFPRHFSINADGSLIAVGLQLSSRVVILARDVETGAIGSPVAHVSLPGQITCVAWDEAGHAGRYD